MLFRSKGAEKFLRENPSSTVYISMTPSTASLNGVCRALAKALKIGGKHNRMDMMEEVRTRLAGTNKVVIVDEAQHLKLPAIEELRSLSDPDIVTGTPGNGVCLIGNSEVFDRIRGKAQAEFAQIFTRVKMPRQYRSSRITKEDVRSLFPAAAVTDRKTTVSCKSHRPRRRIPRLPGAMAFITCGTDVCAFCPEKFE